VGTDLVCSTALRSCERANQYLQSLSDIAKLHTVSHIRADSSERYCFRIHSAGLNHIWRMGCVFQAVSCKFCSRRKIKVSQRLVLAYCISVDLLLQCDRIYPTCHQCTKRNLDCSGGNNGTVAERKLGTSITNASSIIRSQSQSSIPGTQGSSVISSLPEHIQDTIDMTGICSTYRFKTAFKLLLSHHLQTSC
jgi:hypothetical protein